ncbi:hypothetical protein FHETE_5072 [Fusarium heterosporum]|uniref:Uncharacterized protein n=1 Tax=Fusarium heterosporum TaxID=42747 RepID=A0A8H5WSA4_FUSHE|nr:hypothetical protein FHETE_5072 [Fusarium heterosporum]
MDDILKITYSGISQIARHVVTILPGGTLFGAAVASGLPRHPHLDIVARLGTVAMVVALGCVISRSHCFTEYPKSLDELVTPLRDFSLIMAVVTSVVAMMMPHTGRTRQPSDGIAEEEGNLLCLIADLRDTLRKSSSNRSWSLASSTSQFDLLSDRGSLDVKFMSGPRSHYSDLSCSKESAITLSSGFERDPSRITEIIQWAITAAPAAFGTRGDLTPTQTMMQQDSA